MNAPVDHANVQATALPDGLVPEPAVSSQSDRATKTPLARETAPAPDDKICWIELRQVPYPPDQQVELLHLQAEAEALLLQLQAMHQRRHLSRGGAIEAPQS
ncbi:hypothetical protein [Nodosilinea nodulosa]|uniref:hypothetical protein n=1 Tax=Nodosilinea nodulosa TaxID=416001 RepID=UPI0003770148|nr:hypothetical protein [Nodosilinea nodulosa]